MTAAGRIAGFVGSKLVTTASSVKIWDPLVRVFHWTLVIAFSVAYLTEGDLQSVHVWAGYTVTGLLAVRLAREPQLLSCKLRVPGVKPMRSAVPMQKLS